MVKQGMDQGIEVGPDDLSPRSDDQGPRWAYKGLAMELIITNPCLQ